MPADPAAADHETPGQGPVATIAVLTFRRPESLLTTLRSIGGATLHNEGDAHLPWRVVDVLIIDNDAIPSAADAVATAQAEGLARVPIRYVHEPAPGLTAARNRALDEAAGDVVVFIDDDERAGPGWPGGLLTMMADTGAHLVGGPVETAFVGTPPAWAVDGGFFERERPVHGARMPWLRSGNLAVDRAAVAGAGLRFDPAFGLSGGEDVAFTRGAAEAGLELRWCDRAPVTEDVGPERTTVGWVMRRMRVGTSNWVRANLSVTDGWRARARFALAGVARVVIGVATTSAGIATRNDVRRVQGLATTWRGVGGIQGLLGRRSETYG
ncbi:MAG: glycosyltransferase [Actinomycetota bacterium]